MTENSKPLLIGLLHKTACVKFIFCGRIDNNLLRWLDRSCQIYKHPLIEVLFRCTHHAKNRYTSMASFKKKTSIVRKILGTLQIYASIFQVQMF